MKFSFPPPRKICLAIKCRRISSLSVVFCFLLISIKSTAQSPPPDLNNETVSKAGMFFKNFGQIIDDAGNVRDDIKYYSESTGPRLYFFDDKVSFTTLMTDSNHNANSICRIDMKFICNEIMSKDAEYCGNLMAYEPDDFYLNYYLPHCSSGITNVVANKFLMYENAYNNIDVHFTNNNMGLKTYFVLHPPPPGTAYSEIKLQFTGQDSISTVANFIALYSSGASVTLPNSVAYQWDAMTSSYLPLGSQPSWLQLNDSTVKMMIPSFDSTQDLIICLSAPEKTTAIANLEWSTFYGASDMERWPVSWATDYNEYYHVMSINGAVFKNTPGTGPYIGQFDLYISSFKNVSEREWGTYYGGSKFERASAIRIYGDGLKLLSGQTESSDLPLGSNSSLSFHRDVYSGGDNDGMLLSIFDDGSLFWANYFGGSGNDVITNMTYGEAGTVLITGQSNSTNYPSSANYCNYGNTNTEFPLCPGSGSRYFQPTVKGGYDGFIAELGLANNSLNWCTFLGGNLDDKPMGINYYSEGNSIALTGYTFSNPNTVASGPITSNSGSNFPIVDPGLATDFVQYARSSTSNETGFIAKFNEDKKLSWSTFYGGDDATLLYNVVTNGDGDVYVSGRTYSQNVNYSSMPDNATPKLNLLYSGTEYNQTIANNEGDAILARFNPSNELTYSMVFGGTGTEFSYADNSANKGMCIDRDDNIYIAGGTRLLTLNGGNVPTMPKANYYNQSNNASINNSNSTLIYAHDGFIARFTPSNQIDWATHFGGDYSGSALSDPQDLIEDIRIGGFGGNIHLYATGHTYCINTPNTPPLNPNGYYDASYNGNRDAFIGALKLFDVGLGINESTTLQSKNLKLYPNPANTIIHMVLQNNSSRAQVGKILISNMIGQVCLSKEVRLIPGQNHYNLDITKLPLANYVVEFITNDGKKETAKLSVIH